jgi:hypothetical protein
MNFDLRTPMGSMFTLMGMILTVFGVVTKDKEAVYATSLGINANLYWGPVLLVFGLILLLSLRLSQKRQALPQPKQAGKTRRKR